MGDSSSLHGQQTAVYWIAATTMDRHHFALWTACLLAIGVEFADAQQPSGAFSWEMQGPAIPGQHNNVPLGPQMQVGPRYDQPYGEPQAAPQPGPPVTTAPVSPVARPMQAAPARPISPALAAAARQAEQHVRKGTDLGNRRAYYSARAELIEALRTIAQTLDVEHRTDGHSQALAAGLRALDESDDFVARGKTFESDLDVARIASVHRTPVVRSDDQGISPREALQGYYTYAQEQLATSAGSEPAGSAALSAFGKLYTVLARDQSTEVLAAEAKAMALHQAALVVDQNNAVAANELGVLLAHMGRHQDAQAWLAHSASLSPQAATWHNLAVVHDKLGQSNLAQQARQQESQLAQRTGRKATSALPEIRWVSPRELDAAPADRPRPPAGPPGGARSASLPSIQPPGARPF